MKTKYLLVFSGMISLLIAGCGPDLARTNYGPEEQQWKDYIQKSYNTWQPPPTPAPYSENTVSQTAASTIDIVPPAATSDIVVTDTVTVTPSTPAPVISSPAAAIPAESTYTVKKGDTLWSIAQKIYGEGSKWTDIKEANKAMLGTSNSLKAGMVLQIPAK